MKHYKAKLQTISADIFNMMQDPKCDDMDNIMDNIKARMCDLSLVWWNSESESEMLDELDRFDYIKANTGNDPTVEMVFVMVWKNMKVA